MRLANVFPVALLCLASGTSASASAPLFAERVSPLLQKRCLACHDGAKKRGGLDLSTRAGALRGGDSGPALVPGAATKSLLIQMVRGPKARMPRAGPKLDARELGDLAR